ncbi:hypothetical protein [Enterobacter mori]|uniref:hypothetical protein n=1 Tax=Enterobacter mori TaxID=539813 RepID=UPI003B843FF3
MSVYTKNAVPAQSSGSDSFDHVIVVDRFSLSGTALCSLARTVFPQAECRHVTTLSQLLSFITGACVEKHFLVIMEMATDSDRFSSCLSILSDILLSTEKRERWKIMVCTDLKEPHLLQAISTLKPASLAYRGESLSALVTCMLKAGDNNNYLSPWMQKKLEQSGRKGLSPCELQWLITQLDGMTLAESAKTMKVEYQTVTTIKQSTIVRLGLNSHTGFVRWLKKTEMVTGPHHSTSVTA